jgi:hypothetical protein
MEFTLKRPSKDGRPTAGIGLWINLTEEQVAVIQPFARQEGISCKEYLNNIARDAILSKIEDNLN